jgi:hypothetical protein
MSISQRNLSGYDLPPIEWERVREAMATDHTQAPDTGGPNRHTTWHVYRIKPATVYAFGTAEPGGATKFEVGGDD